MPPVPFQVPLLNAWAIWLVMLARVVLWRSRSLLLTLRVDCQLSGLPERVRDWAMWSVGVVVRLSVPALMVREVGRLRGAARLRVPGPFLASGPEAVMVLVR